MIIVLFVDVLIMRSYHLYELATLRVNSDSTGHEMVRQWEGGQQQTTASPADSHEAWRMSHQFTGVGMGGVGVGGTAGQPTPSSCGILLLCWTPGLG